MSSGLSPEVRAREKLIIMTEREGMSYRAIARELGKTSGLRFNPGYLCNVKSGARTASADLMIALKVKRKPRKPKTRRFRMSEADASAILVYAGDAISDDLRSRMEKPYV